MAAAGPTIVFCRTKHGADRSPRSSSSAGVRSAAIHGDRSQGQRERALAASPTARCSALVATDVAARGIHVDGVACVVHFDPPADYKDYMHRSGRTARAGADGIVVSLVSSDQKGLAARFQRELGQRGGPTKPDVRRPRRARPRRGTRAAARGSPSAATSTVADGRPRGTIKWFDARKGFGFIERSAASATCSSTSRRSRATATAAWRRARSSSSSSRPGNKGEQARRVRVLAAA